MLVLASEPPEPQPMSFDAGLGAAAAAEGVFAGSAGAPHALPPHTSELEKPELLNPPITLLVAMPVVGLAPAGDLGAFEDRLKTELEAG